MDLVLAADLCRGLLADLLCPLCTGSPVEPGQRSCPWDQGQSLRLESWTSRSASESGLFTYELDVLEVLLRERERRFVPC